MKHKAKIVMQQTPDGLYLTLDGSADDILQILPIGAVEVLKSVFGPEGLSGAVAAFKTGLDEAIEIVQSAGATTIDIGALRAEGGRAHE